MDAHQNGRCSLFGIALNDGHMLATIKFIAIADRPEIAEGARQPGFGLAAHKALGIKAIANQVGNGNQPQPMALGVGHQLGQAGHGSVMVLDLTDNTRWIEARQLG